MYDEPVLVKKKNKAVKKEIKSLFLVFIAVFFVSLLSSSYAIFNYSRTGEDNVISTGTVTFNFTEGSGNLEKGNVFPIEESDIDNTITRTFNITAHNDYSEGVNYRVYVVYGDNVSGKTRLRDDVISFEFTTPADANGFTNNINACATASSLSFVNGKALVASGTIKDTSSSTTKSYTLKMFIDSNKINVSSTTKRANNLEGNPSLASTASGLTTATRYMRNDTTESKTVTLYPASELQEGHIIYTTNEFSNSFYSFKILIEAEEVLNTKMVYLDANGGSVSNPVYQVTPGSNYPTLPTPTRDGYTFLGWNGKNLFNEDELLLAIDGATYTDNHYVFYAQKANKIYGNGIPLNLSNDKQYTISLSGYRENSGFYIGFMYTDDTKDRYILNSASETVGTVTSTKDIKYAYMSYGNNQGIAYISYIQIEEGDTATAYEPYYVDNTVIVTQEKDHVLKAIWQKNS